MGKKFIKRDQTQAHLSRIQLVDSPIKPRPAKTIMNEDKKNSMK